MVLTYYDIQRYGNSIDVLAERNQRNREEDYARESEYATGKRIRPYGIVSSKESKEIVKQMCKDLFKYTVEEVEAMYARP